MKSSLENLIEEAKKLPIIPLNAATEYNDKIDDMLAFVDSLLVSEPFLNSLIGNNPQQVMFSNHKHHSAFMGTVFIIGNYELLAKTTPWVYRAYASHNFKYDYFQIELKGWLAAIDKFMNPELSKEIKEIYSWMINVHETVIEISEKEEDLSLEINEEWLEVKNSFESAAMIGDYKKCLKMGEDYIQNSKDMEQFYLQIIQPTLYDIGMLWEKGKISVAEEHLVSAISARVMSSIALKLSSNLEKRGKIVVTSSPNELHEIGGWMISDILEQDGWDIRSLGANTPADDLLLFLSEVQPEILMISVTMPFNILNAKKVIDRVKSDDNLRSIKIMIGGRPFNDTKDLWKSTGADGFAVNAEEAKKIADGWFVDEAS